MPFTFQAQPDASLWLVVFRRAARRYALCLGAVFIVIALITAGAFGNYQLALLYTAMAVFFVLWAPRRIVELSMQRNAAKIGLVTSYRFDDQGIRIATGFEEHSYVWSEVAAVKEWKGQFAVFTGPRFAAVPHRRLTMQIGRRVLSVPTGGLTEQQRVDLGNLLRSRGTTAMPVAAG